MDLRKVHGPLKQIQYGVYADLIIIYLRQYSIYFTGAICDRGLIMGGCIYVAIWGATLGQRCLSSCH